MRIIYSLVVILILPAIITCLVAGDSEEGVDVKNRVLPATDVDDKAKKTVDPKDSELNNNGVKGQLDPKGGEGGGKKVSVGTQKDDPKENEGSTSKSIKESKEKELLLVKEKCDSLSNRCMDNEKTFVACLRVPGNESPDLSLLIQNKGKSTLSITFSVPALVELEKEKIELQENKDTEVKVSIKGVESDYFIKLIADHGSCTLKFKDQFVSRKKDNHSPDSSYFNIFKLTLSKGFLFAAALLIVVVSVLMCAKLRRKYIARKNPIYQKLDMELPVSHGSKVDSNENEGWDDSWGDSWDDEEAPTTPSLPVTPSLSSKGISSRKFKEGWKD